MGVSYNPKIVTNGLLIYLDAGNTKSYSGSGNDWYDLSGNRYHMSLKNSPTFVSSGNLKYFDLNGSTHHGICDGTITNSVSATVSNLGLGGTNPKTVVCVAMVDNAVGSTNGGLFDLGDTGGTNSHYSLRLSSSYTGYRAQFWGAADYDFTYDTRTFWTMFSVTYGADKLGRTYGNNAALLGQESTAYDLNTAGVRPFEMGRYNGSDYFGGKIALCMVYNKALTVSEIQQNFNALRGRFSI